MYCFDTVETIPDGLGFSHYDATHFTWLLSFVVFTVLISLLYSRATTRAKLVLRRVIGLLIIADELFKWFTLFMGGNAAVSYLPFHLCSINIFLIAIHIFKPFKWLGDFLYLICIPAAIAALLFPTWTALPATSFMCIHSFSVHILLAAYPIMLTVGGDIHPTVKQLPMCLGLLFGMAAIVYGINMWLDTNFMFLMSADKGNPLYWFEVNWGNHLLGFPILLPAVIAVMYGIVYGVRGIRNHLHR